MTLITQCANWLVRVEHVDSEPAPLKKDRTSSAARVFDSDSLMSSFFWPATVQILEWADPT
jgi:hypothetical protein